MKTLTFSRRLLTGNMLRILRSGVLFAETPNANIATLFLLKLHWNGRLENSGEYAVMGKTKYTRNYLNQ